LSDALAVGNQAIEMLKFIESASNDEENNAIDTEKKEQGDFEGAMQAPGPPRLGEHAGYCD